MSIGLELDIKFPHVSGASSWRQKLPMVVVVTVGGGKALMVAEVTDGGDGGRCCRGWWCWLVGFGAPPLGLGGEEKKVSVDDFI